MKIDTKQLREMLDSAIEHQHDNQNEPCQFCDRDGLCVAERLRWLYALEDVAPRLLDELDALREVAEIARGCGNSPCILHIGPYTGQHTNGGCRCKQAIADALAKVPGR